MNQSTTLKKFANREEAGQLLAEKLENYQNDPKAIVLALPRGGVVVAFQIAKSLRLPLDIVVVRKIGAPGNPEFAIGAIDEKGEGLFDENILAYYEISERYLQQMKVEETAEALRRLKIYRGNRRPLDLKGKTVILVDDGIATGFTMRAAINSVRSKEAKRIVLAIPVAPPEIVNALGKEVDEIVVLESPSIFIAVGRFYEEFEQTADKEVIDLIYKKSF